jgi:hypothetical protein
MTTDTDLREKWKIEIDRHDDPADDFPYWTIQSKDHGIYLRADTLVDLQAAVGRMCEAIALKYTAAVEAHSRVAAFVEPMLDGCFDQVFLGKDAFHDDAA